MSNKKEAVFTSNTVLHAADVVTKGFDTTLKAVKDSFEKSMKTAAELASFNHGSLETFIKASQVYAAGLQDISKHLAASGNTSLDASVSFTKSLFGVKTIAEAVNLHSGFTRGAIERAVVETNKMADASTKLAEQAIAPLTARLALAAATFSKIA